jgi:peptidoglycan hydrolase-like protein with peptidoglycan-binding domain
MLREDTSLMVSKEPYLSEANLHQSNDAAWSNFIIEKNDSNSLVTSSNFLLEESITIERFQESKFQGLFPKNVSQDILDTANFSNESNYADPLTGSNFTNNEVILDAAISQAREQLNIFVSDREFLVKMNQAFGHSFSDKEASTLIQNLASGEVLPTIEVIPSVELNNANGAFGNDRIYLSEKFLSQNTHNPEIITDVVLEEIGHYIDRELNVFDASGDEGNIFAQFVQGETMGEAKLKKIKAEDDGATISINGDNLAVELSESPYQGISPDAAERRSEAELAEQAASYPGYALKYDPNNPNQYDEDPEVVRLWQQRMQDLGYTIEVDGYYGEQSAGVARQFQADNGLEVDGYVGPITWEASFSLGTPTADSENSSSPTTPDAAERSSEAELAEQAASYPGYALKYDPNNPNQYDEDPEVVRLWQQRMQDLGYEIEVDGYYGEQSAGVARQFQADNGLEVDGYVGPITWEASFSLGTPTADSNDPPDNLPQNGSASSSFGDAIVDIAYDEWGFFSQGTLKETDEGAWQRIADYWQSVNLNYTGQDTDVPWSAAFISWVMQEAGAGDRFEYNASHSYYIEDAIQDRNANDPEAVFFGYSLDEYSPEVGDLVSYSRQDGVGYGTPAPYQSHSDIVVAKRDGEIDVIGGNVSDSVTLKTLEIDSEGRLIDTSYDWFAVLRNQGADSASSSSPTTPDAAERRSETELAEQAASYPGYALKYDPNNPNQYDEDPEVVRLWQQRMLDLGYTIEVDGYYGEQSAGVARQFQEDNGLEVDGYVGPITWEASFSLGTPTADSENSSSPTTPDATEPSSTPNTSPDTEARRIQAERIDAYESLYEREFEEEREVLENTILDAETTWNKTAQEMLEDNKDFLKLAADYHNIDGRAIAGAIRWEYEVNWDSRRLDFAAYDFVQSTGELPQIAGRGLNGNGWGKMHYNTAIDVLKESGEEVPDDRTLAKILALPTSSIDLIARFMDQAAKAYSEEGFNIRYDPAVLATLYRIGEDDKSFEQRAGEIEKNDEPEPEKGEMGKWVSENLTSLEEYKTVPV